MASNSVRLFVDHLWESPYVLSTFVALREKGIAFETTELNLGIGEQRAASYAGRALTARVPAIDHDGFVLTESAAIAEYLEEVFPPPTHQRLFPAELRDRAKARQVMGWLRSDLLALREARPTATLFFARAKEPLSPKAQAAADKLVRVTEALLPAGATSLFGSWTLADSELSLMLHRLVLNGDALPARIREYAEAQWARPSVQEFVKHPRPEKPG